MRSRKACCAGLLATPAGIRRSRNPLRGRARERAALASASAVARMGGRMKRSWSSELPICLVPAPIATSSWCAIPTRFKRPHRSRSLSEWGSFIRVGEVRRRTGQDPVPGTTTRPLRLHPDGRHLQSHQTPQAAGDGMMIVASAMAGKWRIVATGAWPREHLDLCGPPSCRSRPMALANSIRGAHRLGGRRVHRQRYRL